MKWVGAAIAQMIFTLLLYVIGIIVIGLAIYPGVLLCFYVWRTTGGCLPPIRILSLCLSITAAYFIYGICLIFIVGIVRFKVVGFVKTIFEKI